MESVCRGNSTVGSNPTLSAIDLERIRQPERCQSGRMGRSRKPLTGQPVRGFESHPLRHSCTTAAGGRASLTYRPCGASTLRVSFEPSGRFRTEPAVPRSMTSTSKKAATRETDFSAQQPSAQADPRLPGADAHPQRPRGDRAAAPEGTQAPERLMAGDRRPPGPGTGAAGERLLSEERLRRRTDYLRCYRTGRRRHGSFAILYFVPNQLGHPRIGITASRKVGKAVVRHRLKRRIKEVYRRWQDRGSLPALDLVVHLKPEAGKSDFPALRAELLRLLGGLRERREPAGVTRLARLPARRLQAAPLAAAAPLLPVHPDLLRICPPRPSQARPLARRAAHRGPADALPTLSSGRGRPALARPRAPRRTYERKRTRIPVETRRLLLAFVLSLAVIAIWYTLFPPASRSRRSRRPRAGRRPPPPRRALLRRRRLPPPLFRASPR